MNTTVTVVYMDGVEKRFDFARDGIHNVFTDNEQGLVIIVYQSDRKVLIPLQQIRLIDREREETNEPAIQENKETA